MGTARNAVLITLTILASNMNNIIRNTVAM